MEKLFIILLSICVSILIAELLIFIGKGIIFIGRIIANNSAEINLKETYLLCQFYHFLLLSYY